MPNRRSLLRASAATWVGTWVASANSQSPTRRVGLLSISEGSNPGFDAFRSRLGELGWVEQRNLVLTASAAEENPYARFLHVREDKLKISGPQSNGGKNVQGRLLRP